jgi:hypothetical protein
MSQSAMGNCRPIWLMIDRYLQLICLTQFEKQGKIWANNQLLRAIWPKPVLLHLINVTPMVQQRMSQSAMGNCRPTWLMTDRFAADLAHTIWEARQNLSKQPASQGNMTQTSAASACQCHSNGPTKDVTKCYEKMRPNLAHDRQVCSWFASQNLRSKAKPEQTTSFSRQYVTQTNAVSSECQCHHNGPTKDVTKCYENIEPTLQSGSLRRSKAKSDPTTSFSRQWDPNKCSFILSMSLQWSNKGCHKVLLATVGQSGSW